MDKVSIRLEAVKAAAIISKSSEELVKNASAIEEYIVGDADIEECYDPNTMLRALNGMLQKPSGCGFNTNEDFS